MNITRLHQIKTFYIFLHTSPSTSHEKRNRKLFTGHELQQHDVTITARYGNNCRRSVNATLHYNLRYYLIKRLQLRLFSGYSTTILSVCHSTVSQRIKCNRINAVAFIILTQFSQTNHKRPDPGVFFYQ